MGTMDARARSPLPDLQGIDDIAGLSEYLRLYRAGVADRVRAGEGGLAVALHYSDGVDALLRRMLALACRKAGGGATINSIPIAVVATGGYGRRELCPYSDIDITFIPHRDGNSLVNRVIKEMFTLVMRWLIDDNKINVGYAYRLMEDCADLEHQTTCGLLDARLGARTAGSSSSSRTSSSLGSTTRSSSSRSWRSGASNCATRSRPPEGRGTEPEDRRRRHAGTCKPPYGSRGPARVWTPRSGTANGRCRLWSDM